MANFLDLTNSLETVTTTREKTRLSKEISLFLKDDPSLANVAARNLARRVLLEIPALKEIVDGDYFTLRINTYQDDDTRYKIAFGVSFLQDFHEASKDIDFTIALALVQEIHNRNLELIINDITVNTEQLRNFDPRSVL